MLSLKLNLSILISSIFLIFLFSCDFIDEINPNVVAKVDNYKIYLSEIKERIKKENPGIKITKPLVLFYINEEIKEKIIEDEFKRLKLKITEKDKKNYPYLMQLNPEELKKQIIFDKVKKYIVRKVTYPSEKECFKYYKNHLNEFKTGPQVNLEYLIFDSKKNCYKFYKVLLKNKDFEKTLKKFHLNLTFKGLIKIKNIPQEILTQIDYTKPNSFWIVDVDDRCYVIKCIKYYPNPVESFTEVKEKIMKRLLSDRQTIVFNYWLKNEMKKRKIKIYYDKIK